MEQRVGAGEVPAILAVLNAVAATIQQQHQRQALLQGLGHGTAHLGAAQHAAAAAEHREILCHDHHPASVDAGRAGDHAIGRRAGAQRLVTRQPTHLNEAAGIAQPGIAQPGIAQQGHTLAR